MASKKTSLYQSLKEIFPGSCLHKKSSYGEQGRKFGIAKQSRDDEIVCVDLNAMRAEKPLASGEQEAECIFVCKSQNQKNMAIVILELKNTHGSRGISQLKATADRFCKKGKQHGYGFSFNHFKVICLLHCKSGLTRNQVIKARLHKNLILKRCKEESVSLDELYGWTVAMDR